MQHTIRMMQQQRDHAGKRSSGPDWRALGLGLAVAGFLLVAGCAQQPTSPDSRVSTPSQDSDERRRARIRLELASAYFSQGQVTTALDEIRQALAVDPSLAEGHNLRGLIYDSLNEEALAQESFQRALQLAPNDADALHNTGWFHCKRGRFQQADGFFDRALAVPNYRDVSKTLLVRGVCHARAGDMAAAEAALYRSYQLDAGNPATAYNLADVMLRRGDYERARFYIRRLNSNPDFVNAQSLWLAARIEQRSGNPEVAGELGRELRNRFPRSREAALYEQGAFND